MEAEETLNSQYNPDQKKKKEEEWYYPIFKFQIKIKTVWYIKSVA